MKFTLKDYMEMTMTVAMIIVLGLLFYMVGRLMAFPGSKIVAMAVFLGFMLACILERVRKLGTLTVTCIVFGGIMSFIIWIMGVVIVISAILSEVIILLLFRKYHDTGIKMATALYAAIAFALVILASLYITGTIVALDTANFWPMMVAGVFVSFVLGYIGGAAGVRLMKRINTIKTNHP